MHSSWILSILSAAGATALTAYNSYPAQSATIPGKYIIKFKTEVVSTAATQLKDSLGAKPDHEYSMGDFHGFAGSLSPEELARLQNSNMVEYIEEDVRMSVHSLIKQNNAPWGLARLSNQKPGAKTYTYDSSAGEGTCVYIIDTGIDTNNTEFEGRATFLIDASREGLMEDGDGHGTHTAGTVGSKTYGVAKKAKLFAIKVLESDGSGTNAGVLKGFDFAVKDAKKRASQCPNGFVANISLGGPKKQNINDAVRNMVEAGIFVAVSAGNEGVDAKLVSPASEPSACTVGAMGPNDTLASFTNFGSLVDVFAPGVNVTSTYLDNGLEEFSGTSMSAPHIAGLGAYLMGLYEVHPKDVCEVIRTLALQNVLTGVPSNTQNLLAFNNATERILQRRQFQA